MCVASINHDGHTELVTAVAPNDTTIRRALEDGDGAGIVDLHRRLYVPEYGINDEFLRRVAAGVEDAIAAGWPRRGGAVWLVDHDGELSGSLALTPEQAGFGRLRWFALAGALRGQGLGRSLVAELLATARDQGFQRLELETFSALTVAARIYRAAGFELTWQRERTDWGPPIVYQHYALELG